MISTTERATNPVTATTVTASVATTRTSAVFVLT
jgi:hypothetical protein